MIHRYKFLFSMIIHILAQCTHTRTVQFNTVFLTFGKRIQMSTKSVCTDGLACSLSFGIVLCTIKNVINYFFPFKATHYQQIKQEIRRFKATATY